MKKLSVLLCGIVLISSCTGQDKSESAAVTLNQVDVASIIANYPTDISKVSYAYGHQLSSSIKNQSIGGLVEVKFIGGYVRGKSDKSVQMDVVRGKLSQIQQQSQSGQVTAATGEVFSENLGLYYGLNESANLFLKKLDVVNFSEGFKDGVIGKNKFGTVTMDSLYMAEQNNFQNYIGAEYLKQNKKDPEVKVTASGLQYKVLKTGEGESPVEASKVTVHYHGTLITGEVFDSSVDRGQPSSFGLTQVIKGWTEGLQLMNKGAKFRFFIPANLAYGDRSQGKISAGSTLVFDVELISF